jgi:hypothetical protein
MSTTVFPEAGDQITEAAWSAQNKALAVGAAYRVSGYTLSAGAGLAVSVAAGEAVVEGYHIVSDGAQTVGSLTASNTNYIWLEADGTLDKNTTGSPSATGALLLGTATTDGSSVTAVSHQRNVSNTFNHLVVKAANEVVNNSVAYQDDDELLFAAAATSQWDLTIVLKVTQASAAAGIKIRLSCDAGTPAFYSMAIAAEDDDGTDTVSSTAASGSTAEFVILGAVTTNQGVLIRAIVKFGASDATLNVEWAQNAATVADTTVGAGSFLYARRILT